jgi:uroporphyrinogen decarboxylase
MNPRERVLTALNRKEPDRVPMEFSLCPSQMERFRKETGADSPSEYFGFGIRGVGISGTKQKNDFSEYTKDYPPGARVDEWGIGWIRTPSSYHFEHILHPLKDAKTVEEIKEYPFPDVDAEYRYEGLEERVSQLKDAGYAVSASAMAVGGTVFWPPYKLRSMEQLLIDFMINPEIADAMLDAVTDRMEVMAGRYAEAGVEILRLADDLGTQLAPIISLKIFRKYIKPRLARVIKAAVDVNPHILIFFHSDGHIQEFIPDLIEIGLDVLNPVQPECMDPAEIKRKYGDHIAFWGTLGTQTTLPFGTVDEVRQVVKERIETVGKGGGLLIAPTHLVEPEVPWENIMAFVEAVEEFGYYN